MTPRQPPAGFGFQFKDDGRVLWNLRLKVVGSGSLPFGGQEER